MSAAGRGFARFGRLETPTYVLITLVGIALLAIGARAGDFGVILLNARILCLSCIGIE
ncbi:MAG: hypothetical protein VB144_15280 [Clostridia bacterium]|nr:hypothetical protein [Clostridia bacterium]